MVGLVPGQTVARMLRAVTTPRLTFVSGPRWRELQGVRC